MRFNHRSPGHWFAIALVLAVGLFTFNHARGQSTGAAAAFDIASLLPGSTTATQPAAGARTDVTLVPRRDDVRRDTRTPPQKVKKTVRRTLQRSRTGVGEIDAIGAFAW